MDCEFEHAKVYVGDNGYVCIQQDTRGETETIILHPEQVSVLVKWLERAAMEALS